jgi:hypothetical protein
MRRRVPLFWVESILAAVSGLLALVTLFRRDWIEAVFRVDPDRQSGWLEWAIVAILVVATAVFSSLAAAERRRVLALSAHSTR